MSNKKWEYYLHFESDGKVEDILNHYGELGWELVILKEYSSYGLFIFKREK